MPDFNILLLDSLSYFNTASIKPGKSSLVFYFKPSCPYCRMETRRIIDNIEDIKDVNVCFVSMAPLSELKKYSNEFGLFKYPNINIGVDTGFAVAEYFKPISVPYLAFYNRNKVFEIAFMGAISYKQLKLNLRM